MKMGFILGPRGVSYNLSVVDWNRCFDQFILMANGERITISTGFNFGMKRVAIFIEIYVMSKGDRCEIQI